MKVAVIGSRGFNNKDLLYQELDKLSPTTIISGGAKGADSIASDYAKEKSIELLEIKPDWKIGRHAGLLRNTEIVKSSEFLLAFWDGKSKGTADSIKKAESMKLPKKVIIYGDI